MRYEIDSKRQSMVLTGVESEAVMVWEEVNGKRKPSATEQERDPDTGMPLWQVEVMYRQETFGRASTITAKVKVGAVEKPQVVEYQPVEFTNLVVEARPNKGGGLTEYWSAEEVSDGDAPAKQTSPSSASKTAAADTAKASGSGAKSEAA